jgi:putative ABC transport system permease protein
MRISTIAFANLKRRKGKALFLVIGIAIGIGTAVALLSLSSSIKEEIGSQLDRFGANIIVLPQSSSLALDYGGINVPGISFDVEQLKGVDAAAILDIPYRSRISVVAPKIIGAAEVATDAAHVQRAQLAGVDFESEFALKRWWRVIGREPEGDDEVIVGYGVARALALIEPTSTAGLQPTSHSVSHEHPGEQEHPPFNIVRDRLDISRRVHKVTGVLAETGGVEDRMIFGRLAHVQALLDKPDQLTMVEVSALCKDCPVGDIVAQISERLPHAKVSALQQSVRARAETIDRLTRFFAIVSAIVLSIGALMIFTTMTGSVIERTKEIGVLRAIGFRKSHIVKGLMIEVTVISVAGGAIGWAAGILASWVALPYFAETDVTFSAHPFLAVAAIAVGLLIGIVSSFYPIIRASRLDPSEAVRYV